MRNASLLLIAEIYLDVVSPHRKTHNVEVADAVLVLDALEDLVHVFHAAPGEVVVSSDLDVSHTPPVENSRLKTGAFENRLAGIVDVSVGRTAGKAGYNQHQRLIAGLYHLLGVEVEGHLAPI